MKDSSHQQNPAQRVSLQGMPNYHNILFNQWGVIFFTFLYSQDNFSQYVLFSSKV